MGTILFIAIMAILIRINDERWWLYCFLFMGLAVQCGYKVGMIGMVAWIGVLKVLKDLCQAK